MKTINKAVWALAAPLLLPGFAAAMSAAVISHELEISISPENRSLSAQDTLTFAAPSSEFIFSLHEGLSPATRDPALKLEKTGAAGIAEIWRLTSGKPLNSFTLKYGGELYHPLVEQGAEYSRSFSETPGVISSSGCWLSGSSFWYPYFENSLVTFSLRTTMPEPYDTVSGGERASSAASGGYRTSLWLEGNPQDGINLACSKYAQYSREYNGLGLFAFLQSPDDKLASAYIVAAEKYLDLYSALIGPYPYKKFALAENFWETGYGVPSFTLLGPQIIRFPFILNSSYPHEILHNWWGNGVFVDYKKGNWCEGLTAYLADCLLSEVRGKSRDYRRTALQKYADYVSGGKDFPLAEFRARRSSASEAVGYGKAMMFYHMLRLKLGDEKFIAGLRLFYRDNKFSYASFSDLRRAFEIVSGLDLKTFFRQWIERPGAPELEFKNPSVSPVAGGYALTFNLIQKQATPYLLTVPVATHLEGESAALVRSVELSKKEESYKLKFAKKPFLIEIDPELDLFRKLGPLDTAPALSRILGSARPLIVLPSAADTQTFKTYSDFALAWNQDDVNPPEIVKDSELRALPADRSFWLLGRENRFTPAFERELEKLDARFMPDTFLAENRSFETAGNTFVFTDLNARNPAYCGALILGGNPGKLSQLAAKLPHYGKYSWLAFDAEINLIKSGVWENKNRPLSAAFANGAGLPYPQRRALAEPASVFSKKRIEEAVSYLAKEIRGRAPGSQGHEKAGLYIEKELRAAGVMPFFGDRFTQEFSGRTSAAAMRFKNIIGKIEGLKNKDKYVVLSAHYDHMPAEDGLVFPGADDNASGAALLLELARYYAKNPPDRTLIITAFDGEEEGRLGSKYFAGSLKPDEFSKINAGLNFDTVGRLGRGKILILGAGSSDKWVHIFRGAGFVTGIDHDLVKQELDSSDHLSFIERGVPAVQFFSGPNADHHKTTDTASKIDTDGIVKMAEFAKETIDYLASDSDFITRPAVPAPGRSDPATSRKISTGLVPDFAFQGKGVRAHEITPGSPLAYAGVRAGDVILKVNGEDMGDLKGYSAALKKLSPGDRIKITWLSDNVQNTTQIELAGR